MNSPGAAVVERTLAFFGRLREAGLPVPPARSVDALKAVAVVDSLEKVVTAVAEAGVEMIADGSPGQGTGRGVRVIERKAPGGEGL